MKYSIITINYNNKEGLHKTIESVINQTCQDFEYIVIDGGSTDSSIDVIREYADRIDYWVSEPDKGIYNAMNKGILQAHGEYLNFMNSGDCFYDVYVLETILPCLDSDIVLGKSYYDGGAHGFKKKNITMLDLYKNTLPHQASFIRRKLFIGHLYDECYKIVSDWKFFVDALIFRNVSFRNIDRIICLFDHGGISSKLSELVEKEQSEICNSYFPERIIHDYDYLVNADSPLLELTPLLNKTHRFQKIVYWVVLILLRMRSIFIFRR